MSSPDPERPLNVALLSPCYWPEVRRGTERFVRELADGLLARGHRPYLITSHPGLPRRSHESGLTVLRLPRPPQNRLVGWGYEPYLTHVPLTYLALRRGNFDVAHAVHPGDALAAARWGARAGRPSVLSYMGIPNLYWLKAARLRLRILRRAVERCDAVVALSRHAATAFEHSLGRRVQTIPPGVDLAAFRPLTPRAAHPTIVCGAAVDVPRKNVALLIAALGLIRQRFPEAQLVLSRPQSLDAARRAGVDVDAPGVRWQNLDDRESLARAYSQAWVAVLPAIEEAFGLVLAEALACGTPVVGLSDAGIPEMIDRPEVGRLFDRLDPPALADAIIEVFALAADPRTVTRCRARAEVFSTDRCTSGYLELYRRLLTVPR